MLIVVKAHPDSGEDLVEKIGENRFVVSVKEPPVQGRANLAIIRLLAKYFKVSPSKIRLVKGFRERNKVFEIT